MPSIVFPDLEVWKEAHQAALQTYALTERLPRKELFGLQAQMRRAAVSVPANIAEGFARPTRPDKLRFYAIARGSLSELRYYGILVRDLHFLEVPRSWTERLDRIGAMLYRLRQAIQTSLQSAP